MTALIVIGSILGYLLIGSIISGIVARIVKLSFEDSSPVLLAANLVWPITILVFIFSFLFRTLFFKLSNFIATYKPKQKPDFNLDGLFSRETKKKEEKLYCTKCQDEMANIYR